MQAEKLNCYLPYITESDGLLESHMHLYIGTRVWSIQETSFELRANPMLPTYVGYNSFLFQIIKLRIRT